MAAKTPRPARIHRSFLEREKAPVTGAFSELLGGDGGNRTRVRNRVKGSVYERSRRSGLVLRSPRRRGCGGPASLESPRFGGGGPLRASLHSDSGRSPRQAGGGRNLTLSY